MSDDDGKTANAAGAGLTVEEREQEVERLSRQLVDLLNSIPGEARDGLRDEVISAVRDETDRDPVGSEQARAEGRIEESGSGPAAFPLVIFGALLVLTGAFVWFMVESIGKLLMVLGAMFTFAGLLGSMIGSVRGKRDSGG